MKIWKTIKEPNVFRILIAMLAVCCMSIFCVPWSKGQSPGLDPAADRLPMVRIGLALNDQTTSQDALELLKGIAKLRKGPIWIQFNPPGKKQSVAELTMDKDTKMSEATAILNFLSANGVPNASVQAMVLGTATSKLRDLSNVSVSLISRDVNGSVAPQLAAAPTNSTFPALAARGATVRLMLAKEGETEDNIILLTVTGEFQLHPFVEVVEALRDQDPVADSKFVVKIPFAKWPEGVPTMHPRLVHEVRPPAAHVGGLASGLPGTPIGSPGPPHIPLGGPAGINPGLAGSISPFDTRVVVQSDTPQSILKAIARQADIRSVAAAEHFRRSGGSDADQKRARKTLTKFVEDAFRTKQAFHEAELEALSQRVARLKSLVSERGQAKDEIIRRRVDELLNPDLRWDADANAAAPVPKASSRSANTKPYRQTEYFHVAADPFGGSVPQHVLNDVAGVAKSAYVGLTKEWFDGDPIQFEKVCGIDVNLSQSLSNSRGMTNYHFTADGRVGGAMMQIDGPERRLADAVNHEVMHLVLAAQFQVVLPRWVDEGIGRCEDAESQFLSDQKLVVKAQSEDKLIPLRELFTMTSYPTHLQKGTLAFAQSHLVVEWLIGRGGKRKLINCMRSVDAKKMTAQLPEAIVSAYGFENFADLESQWIASIGSIKSINSQVQTDPFGG